MEPTNNLHDCELVRLHLTDVKLEAETQEFLVQRFKAQKRLSDYLIRMLERSLEGVNGAREVSVKSTPLWAKVWKEMANYEESDNYIGVNILMEDLEAEEREIFGDT